MSSPNQQALLSEEDIRTRVVATWLADHGFTAENISVEFSFELRLGRNVYRVGKELPHSPTFRPRADVLVRSSDGRNLLIIEVKAPNEILDENVKEQGISYARLLKSGGIAPFVVVTNGHETQIYDSITGESMQGVHVPTNHPHAQNGFRISADDVALRAEALEIFISLSSENFLTFCRAQVSQRMRLLRSDDPFSGKKYIRALYVEREDAKKQLSKMLDEEHHRVVLLVGAPQVGKTNFICHTVEERLQNGQPCLFYPAIGMEKELVEEISEDFNWIFPSSSTLHQIINRVIRILQSNNQRLLIFIDGWNEASQELARTIDRGAERLSCNEIQIVISLTNIAARRLLNISGNPTYISELAEINSNIVTLLEISPEKLEDELKKQIKGLISENEKPKPSLISLKEYTSPEIKKAHSTYSKAFNIQIPEAYLKINNPFLLRLIVEFAKSNNIDLSDDKNNSVILMDEPELLLHNIFQKTQRASDLERYDVNTILVELGNELLLSDAPADQLATKRRLDIPITQELPKGLFESALLAKVHSNSHLQSLDFYFDRERNFVISYWARNWCEKLSNSKDALSELFIASRSKVGLEAIKWFLSQPSNQYCFLSVSEVLDALDKDLIRLILSAARESITRSEANEIGWILNLIRQSSKIRYFLIKAEVSELVSVSLKVVRCEQFNALLSQLYSDKELISNLLDFDSNEWLNRGKTGFFIYDDEIQLIIDALKYLHLYVCPHGDEETQIVEILSTLIFEDKVCFDIRNNAARILGYVDPYVFLRLISSQIVRDSLDDRELKRMLSGAELALDELEEIYYGSTCPGYIETLAGGLSETLLYEYERMFNISIALITYYPNETVSQGLLKILNALRELVEKIDPEDALLDLERVKNLCFLPSKLEDNSVCQLCLPFEFLSEGQE